MIASSISLALGRNLSTSIIQKSRHSLSFRQCGLRKRRLKSVSQWQSGTGSCCLISTTAGMKLENESSLCLYWSMPLALGHRKVQKNAGLGHETDNCITFAHEFERMCQRRLQREPVQYIIGEWEFRSINLLMKAPVFIPRPETEGFIDLIHNSLPAVKYGNSIEILEVGCGTGAISLSLLHENPKVVCTAIDISKDAVDLCIMNAKRLNLIDRITIHHCGVEEIGCLNLEKKFNFIVSNPPYIPEKDMETLQPEVAKFEDHRALCGGTDGLDIVRCLLREAPKLLLPGGSVWLEVDATHPPMITNLMSQMNSSFLKFKGFYQDIYERPRFCHLQSKSSESNSLPDDVT